MNIITAATTTNAVERRRGVVRARQTAKKRATAPPRTSGPPRSERRFHLAGRVATTLCNECLGRGWLQRKPQSRALEITPGGQVALRDWLGLALWQQVMAH